MIHERLDGEVIVLDMLTGKYFSLDGCAADIWTMIHFGLHRSSWDVQLRSAYGQSTSFPGIDEFVAQLMELGLITPDDQSPGAQVGELPADRQRDKWTKPILHSYDDLTDLLLIDPIHDTSEEGWPSRG